MSKHAFSTPTTRSALPALARLLAITAAAGLALAGCSRENPTSKGVKAGARDLHAVSGGAAAFPPAESAKKGYTAVGGAVQGVADKGRPGDNSAANLLLSRSQSGLGEAAVTAAFAAEREGMNRLTVLRAQLNEFADRSVSAQSAGSFDPTARIAELGKSAADLGKQIETANAAKAVLDQKIAELREQAKAKLDEAQPHQVAYAELRQQASAMTATAGEPLIKQANERKRAGDKLRTEADWLNAQADQIAPQSTEAGVNISKLQTLKAGLEGEAKALADQAAAAKKLAAEARAAATSAADELRKKLDELEAFRAGPLTKAGDEALKAFNAALGSAKKAQQDSSGQSRAIVGELQQSIGDVHLARAIGTKQYADFLSALATTKPEFPDAAKYADAAKAAIEAKNKSIADAKAAYEAAKAAYEGSGAKGETKDRMQKVGETLGKLSEFVEGKDADFGTLLTVPKPAPKTEAPAAAAPAPSDPVAAVRMAFAEMVSASKSGKFDKVADMLWSPPGEGEAMLASTKQTLGGLGRVDAACRAKFGKGLMEGASGNPMMQGMTSQLGGLSAIDPATVKIEVAGADATVSGAGIPNVMKLHNVNGQWKQVFDISAVPQQTRGLMSKMAEPLAKACDEAVAGINSGSIESPEAAMNSIGMAVQAAVMQMMQDPAMQKLIQEQMRKQNGGG